MICFWDTVWDTLAIIVQTALLGSCLIVSGNVCSWEITSSSCLAYIYTNYCKPINIGGYLIW